MPHGSAERPIAVYGAVAANAAIAVAKLVVAGVSGSSAMLSEGIHSIVDTGNELLLLLGVHRARRPPDEQHPYGHGKEVYFFGLIVAIVLFAAGGGVSVYEGILHLEHPAKLESPGWQLGVLLFALLFESTSLAIAVRELRKHDRGESLFRALHASKDPSVYTVVAEDIAAVMGVLVAAAGVITAWVLDRREPDAIASIAVGAILGTVAIFLAAESRALLVGESGDRRLVDDVLKLVLEDPGVIRAGRPLTMHLGPRDILLNLELEFDPKLDVAALPATVQRIERRIRAAHPDIRRIFLEAASFGRSSGTPA